MAIITSLEHLQLYLIRATVGLPNQQNLYPKAPTAAVAKLLQYSGLGSNSGMGFLRVNDLHLA